MFSSMTQSSVNSFSSSSAYNYGSSSAGKNLGANETVLPGFSHFRSPSTYSQTGGYLSQPPSSVKTSKLLNTSTASASSTPYHSTTKTPRFSLTPLTSTPGIYGGGGIGAGVVGDNYLVNQLSPYSNNPEDDFYQSRGNRLSTFASPGDGIDIGSMQASSSYYQGGVSSNLFSNRLDKQSLTDVQPKQQQQQQQSYLQNQQSSSTQQEEDAQKQQHQQQEEDNNPPNEYLSDEHPSTAILPSMATESSTIASSTTGFTKTPKTAFKKLQIFGTPDESATRSSPLTSRKRVRNTITSSIHQSPTQIDPFFDRPNLQSATGEDVATTSSDMNGATAGEWVTVFGFPPSKASFIINQFSQYGKILDHKMGDGNWMHIAYETKFQAQKALSKNGKTFDRVLMIGVVECLDPSVTGRPKRSFRMVRLPTKDSLERDRLGAGLIGTKRIFSESSAAGLDSAQYQSTDDFPPFNSIERAQKRARPQPQKSFLSKVLDNVFKF